MTLTHLTQTPSPSISPSISNPSGMALSSRNLANVLTGLDFHIRETAARQDPNPGLLLCGLFPSVMHPMRA
jgi:hypothetical protein